MGFGTGGAAGWGAGTGLVGIEAALATLGSATLTEEGEGDFGAGLAAGLTVALTVGLATGFITDLTTFFLPATSLVADFLEVSAFLTATGLAFNGGTACFAAGFAADLVATFTGGLLFLAGVFTSGLLWALAWGWASVFKTEARVIRPALFECSPLSATDGLAFRSARDFSGASAPLDAKKPNRCRNETNIKPSSLKSACTASYCGLRRA